MADATKQKQITLRVTLEDYLLIRDAAFAKGKSIGPTVEIWIQPMIDRLRKAKKGK